MSETIALTIDPPQHLDTLVRALPAWLANATPAQHERYSATALLSAASQLKVRELFSRFEPADRFVETRLSLALKQRFVTPVDLRQSELICLDFGLANPQLQTRRQVKATRHSLLAAAMAGFTANEAEHGFQLGSVILPMGEFKLLDGANTLYSYDRTLELPISPAEFAEICRGADLGKAYRRHFNQVFDSGSSGVSDEDPAWVNRLLEENLCHDLQLQAYRARFGDALSEPALQVVLQLASAGAAKVTWANKVVEVHALRLLASWSQSGMPLRSVVLMSQGTSPDAPCIAYIPGDPQQPLKQYDSAQAFAEDLRERLRDSQYQAFFLRFVPLDQQMAFTRRLTQTLSPVSVWYPSQPGVADADADLGVRLDAVEKGLVPWLREQRLEPMREDSRSLVVANADVDRRVRQARIEALVELGMDALQVAAAFVPVVGALMVGVGALQLLEEVFVGVDDWSHGQTHEALEHLLSVAKNAGLIAVTAGVGIAVQRSSFVEGMLPVLDSHGRVRLSASRLEAFASDVQLPDGLAANASGQFEWQGEHYIRLQGCTYRQTFDAQTKQWTIPHSNPQMDQRLALLHNGEGAWRLAHEDPGKWTAMQALRRLGPDLDGLDDTALQQLHRASGYSTAELQRIHTDHLSWPALLRESAEDMRTLQRIGRLPAEQQAAHWREWRQRPDADTGPLQRDFPGLPASVRAELLAGARRAERTQLIEQQKVPLRLAEQARILLRERQLNLALAGVLWPDVEMADSLLLKHALGKPGDTAMDLFLRATDNRDAAASAIGQRRVAPWWRPPAHLPDGRLGYALSGRPAGLLAQINRRLRRLRRLYPQLDDQQLEGIQAELGEAVERNITLRATEYENLRNSLLQWVDEPAVAPNEEGEQVAVDPSLRTRAMHLILAAWRREAPTSESIHGRGTGYVLDLGDLPIGNLPPLNADFSHVYLLTFDGCGLEELPAGWLRRFPHLEELELQGNRLTRIPPDVRVLADLDSLIMDNNRLLPSATLFEPLSNLRNLQALVLRGNPMQMPSQAMAALGRLSSLSTLSMDHVAVGQVPELLTHLQGLSNLWSLWLRDNELVMTPGVMRSLESMHNLQHLDLSGNPLGAELDLHGLRDIGVLGLRNCGLTVWPRGLTELMSQEPTVLRSVALDDNPLTEVPVLEGLPFFSSDPDIAQPLRISAEHLDALSRERLIAAGVHAVDLVPEADDWLIDCPEEVLGMVRSLRTEPAADAFLQMLDRLHEVQDYRLDRPRGRLRVQALVRALVEPGEGDDGQGLEDLRRQVFMIGDEVRDTCGDGIQLLLQRSETLVLAHQAAVASALEDGPPTALLRLSRQLYRADLLDDAAVRIGERRAAYRTHELDRQLHQAMHPGIAMPGQRPALYPQDAYDLIDEPYAPDIAEIRLQLRLDLQGRLDLHAQPASMRYFQPLADSLREQVVSDVQAQDTDAGFIDWLDAQPYWTERLERRYRARFDAVFREWNEGQLYLFEIASSDPQPGEVSAQVRAVLTDVLGEREWVRDGAMQVVRLSEEEQERARQALLAGMAQARAALRQALTRAWVLP